MHSSAERFGVHRQGGIVFDHPFDEIMDTDVKGKV